jgi:hypothetical protein
MTSSVAKEPPQKQDNSQSASVCGYGEPEHASATGAPGKLVLFAEATKVMFYWLTIGHGPER